jgi:AraC family transcriptional regulator
MGVVSEPVPSDSAARRLPYQPPSVLDGGPGRAGNPAAARRARRASTLDARWRAVERVTVALRERFAEPFSLDEMARIAISSPYHFNRVFRQVTGLPPGRFLWALRIQAAKRLLVATDRSVTSVCFEVGYSSLGTFSTHFSEYVGTSPGRMRHAARTLAVGELLRRYADEARGEPDPAQDCAAVTGRVRVPPEFEGLVVVGLFRTPLPRGHPVACGPVDGAGDFRLTAVPDGRYYLFAAGLEFSGDSVSHLVNEPRLRGRAGPLIVSGGVAFGSADLCLRPPRITDPPILASLPVLIEERAGAPAWPRGLHT